MQPLMLNEFLNLAKKSKRVAVFDEISAGELTPEIIYTLVNNIGEGSGVMFEDLHKRDRIIRYSYLCFDPVASLIINDNDSLDLLISIRNLQLKNSYITRDDVSELITNSLGFISYDAVRYFEDIPNRHLNDNEIPIVIFNTYSLSLTFNHEKKTILISYVVDTSHDAEQAYYLARDKLESVIDILTTSQCSNEDHNCEGDSNIVEIDISDNEFIKMVEEAKRYISNGDAFQIVISRCYRRGYSISPFEIYKKLRNISPASFMFYIPTKNGVIIGASPERLIQVQNNKITANPIAGTRKRVGNKDDDFITADLLNDKKEVAEHMMLVDLARNDVGAVAIPGSVQVAELLTVKHYSHISHISSTVIGVLQDKYDALDAFAASFPAGTISGAPKIRAMQLIDRLETSRRGLYGGAICRFDSAGNFDSCIAIRMAHLKDGIATIRTGAGIVFDSNPAAEANETHQKAHSILDAIAKAHGG